MEVLVTGATGLIGAGLTSELVAAHRVTALTRRDVAKEEPIRWVEGDLRRLPEVALPSRIDAVVHLAQSRNYRQFPEQAEDIFAVNVASTAALAAWACRSGAKTFVYASSGGIYGHGKDVFREDDRHQPPERLGYYLASKRAAEVLLEAYSTEITVVILRFFFVYGPGQAETMLIPRLVRSVASGMPISLQGPDGLRTNPVHVSDATRAIAAALHLASSDRINVAGPDVLSLRSIAEAIGERVGRRPRFEADQSGPPRDLIGDTAKMSRLLAPPRIHFVDGICGVVDGVESAASP